MCFPLKVAGRTKAPSNSVSVSVPVSVSLSVSAVRAVFAVTDGGEQNDVVLR